jgi:hypothetical protein
MGASTICPVAAAQKLLAEQGSYTARDLMRAVDGLLGSHNCRPSLAAGGKFYYLIDDPAGNPQPILV